MSDVIFLVGETEEKIYGHKLLLSLSSPHWSNIFYQNEDEIKMKIDKEKEKENENENEKQNENENEKQQEKQIINNYNNYPKKKNIIININDLSKEVFLVFLRFSYLREITLSGELVWKVLEACEKYPTKDLKQLCLKYIDNNINTCDCFEILKQADDMKLIELVKRTLIFIQHHSKQIFSRSGCLNEIREEHLLTLLNSERLDVPEIELFRRCIERAKYICKNVQKIPINAKNLNNILAKIKPKIKLHLMTGIELQEVEASNLFTVRELFDVISSRKQRNFKRTRKRRKKARKEIRVLLLACEVIKEPIEEDEESQDEGIFGEVEASDEDEDNEEVEAEEEFDSDLDGFIVQDNEFEDNNLSPLRQEILQQQLRLNFRRELALHEQQQEQEIIEQQIQLQYQQQQQQQIQEQEEQQMQEQEEQEQEQQEEEQTIIEQQEEIIQQITQQRLQRLQREQQREQELIEQEQEREQEIGRQQETQQEPEPEPEQVPQQEQEQEQEQQQQETAQIQTNMNINENELNHENNDINNVNNNDNGNQIIIENENENENENINGDNNDTLLINQEELPNLVNNDLIRVTKKNPRQKKQKHGETLTSPEKEKLIKNLITGLLSKPKEKEEEEEDGDEDEKERETEKGINKNDNEKKSGNANSINNKNKKSETGDLEETKNFHSWSTSIKSRASGLKTGNNDDLNESPKKNRIDLQKDELEITDVINSIQSTGIHQVDFIDIRKMKNIPTLEKIVKYDCIFFYANDKYEGQVEIGDLLADYVQDGGGLVVCCGSALISNSKAELKGRIIEEDFLPVKKAKLLIGHMDGLGLQMGQVFNPEHPIMKRVQYFKGGEFSYRACIFEANKGANVIAKWEDEMIFIAEKKKKDGYGTIAVLNFYPVSDKIYPNRLWHRSTDGQRIIANAVEFVANN
ncbi:btb/poz domain-containing [Anaeramoeba flamelloides]|uniref:Btb/poz domain-containing n=1 Tax=Anaeramoeba flamelloides TaxID=1746091 RepID=A0ABQ8YG86_9EUKA|nr:btb/poz domain-containing [Anaeramoeba flamelloides]